VCFVAWRWRSLNLSILLVGTLSVRLYYSDQLSSEHSSSFAPNRLQYMGLGELDLSYHFSMTCYPVVAFSMLSCPGDLPGAACQRHLPGSAYLVVTLTTQHHPIPLRITNGRSRTLVCRCLAGYALRFSSVRAVFCDFLARGLPCARSLFHHRPGMRPAASACALTGNPACQSSVSTAVCVDSDEAWRFLQLRWFTPSALSDSVGK
jgi:hypothetical protein